MANLSVDWNKYCDSDEEGEQNDDDDQEENWEGLTLLIFFNT